MGIALILLAVVMFYCLRSRKSLTIEIEHNNMRVRGRELMAEMNTLQKMKLTAQPNGAVMWDTLEAHIADEGISITLEAIEGEHAFYAKAVAEGQTVVGVSVLSTNGELLGALIQIDVIAGPANSLVIVASAPEPL